MHESLQRKYSHVGCISEDKLVKKIHCSKSKGKIQKGGPWKRWTDAMSELLIVRGISDKDTG